MAEAEKPQEAVDLKAIQKKLSAGASYRRMLAAKEAGLPICVASAGVPSELLFAMDVFPIYPESLAAISSGVGKADEFFDEAKARDFSSAICSYTRCGLGIAWSNKCAFGPLPEPDLFMTDVSLCCLHVTWWAYLGDHFKKPTFFADMPATDNPDAPEYIAYYEKQLRDMITFIEDNTKIKFDLNRLKQTVSYSDLAGHYWRQLLNLRMHKPSPSSFRVLAGQILPLVTALGDKDTAEYYEAFYNFYKGQVAQGVTPAKPEEKFRLIWNGIPIWHHLDIINYFENKGANFVWEPYTNLSWGNKTPSGRLDPEDPFHSLAIKYTNVLNNRPIKDRFQYFDQAVKDYDIDGLVMFSNRSCRPMSIGQDEVVEMVREKHGLPVLIFEGDQADAEGFSWQDSKVKIDGFIEILESKKK
ncbi:MAG: 2-hydroxyacyl-CoA dehydratase family protein [Proteobacteria bacterium]|nr:2-hydroxyacyl-CoA dehydratase family protein [Pseudomonadota bacterium]